MNDVMVDEFAAMLCDYSDPAQPDLRLPSGVEEISRSYLDDERDFLNDECLLGALLALRLLCWRDNVDMEEHIWTMD